jgi:hypothetical protein
VADLCAALGAPAGIEAVTIGGSRAAGTADDASDWDLGLYYRGQVDLATLARYGEVHPPGSWGRIMNGGAWLTLQELKVACRRRQWVLNEKKLVEQVGLDGLHEWFTRIPRSAAPLIGWVSEVRAALAQSG